MLQLAFNPGSATQFSFFQQLYMLHFHHLLALLNVEYITMTVCLHIASLVLITDPSKRAYADIHVRRRQPKRLFRQPARSHLPSSISHLLWNQTRKATLCERKRDVQMCCILPNSLLLGFREAFKEAERVAYLQTPMSVQSHRGNKLEI